MNNKVNQHQKAPTLANIQGVIFDLDGTLVESSLNFANIKKQICCPESIDLLHFIEQLPFDEQQQANDIVLEHELKDAENAKPILGVHNLLNFLEQAQIPTAIVTRNCVQASQIKLQQNNIHINTVITRHDYAPKPAPDALVAIAKQWQLPSANLIYVGDYLFDIQAAHNANMLACFINHGQEKPYQHQADVVVMSLSQLHQKLLNDKAEITNR
ncbi:HAD family hydrolase [Shewanella maritima]|uniref:HAD family hydrolase n=1 Tax=Shewanella maritima TaxID=2520507 RepID=UPI003735C46D